MKRILVLLLVGWSLTGIVCAQSKKAHKKCNCDSGPKEITINFLKKTEPVIKINKIRKGDYYTIRIDSINLNLFKVILSTKDTSSGKALETPAFGSFNMDALSKLAAGVGPLSTALVKSEKLPAGFKVTETKLYEELIATINKCSKSCYELTDSSFKLSRIIDSMKLVVYRIRLNALKLENPGSVTSFSSLLIGLVGIRIRVTGLQSQIMSKKKEYEQYIVDWQKVIAANDSISKKDKAIKDAFDKLILTATDMSASVSADKINELLTPVVLIENNSGNTYKSFPVQFLGDQALVKLSIVPRDEKLNLQPYNIQIVFPTRRCYADIGLSYYASKVHDEAYTVVESIVAADTVFDVKSEGRIDFEMGLTALLRVGIKVGRTDNFGFHGSMGAGVSFAHTVKPRLFAGVGFSFGTRHMIAVDFGAVMGYYDRLSDSYDLSTQYQFNPGTVTVSKPDGGFFVALGYIYHF